MAGVFALAPDGSAPALPGALGPVCDRQSYRLVVVQIGSLLRRPALPLFGAPLLRDGERVDADELVYRVLLALQRAWRYDWFADAVHVVGVFDHSAAALGAEPLPLEGADRAYRARVDLSAPGGLDVLQLQRIGGDPDAQRTLFGRAQAKLHEWAGANLTLVQPDAFFFPPLPGSQPAEGAYRPDFTLQVGLAAQRGLSVLCNGTGTCQDLHGTTDFAAHALVPAIEDPDRGVLVTADPSRGCAESLLLFGVEGRHLDANPVGTGAVFRADRALHVAQTVAGGAGDGPAFPETAGALLEIFVLSQPSGSTGWERRLRDVVPFCCGFDKLMFAHRLVSPRETVDLRTGRAQTEFLEVFRAAHSPNPARPDSWVDIATRDADAFYRNADAWLRTNVRAQAADGLRTLRQLGVRPRDAFRVLTATASQRQRWTQARAQAVQRSQYTETQFRQVARVARAELRRRSLFVNRSRVVLSAVGLPSLPREVCGAVADAAHASGHLRPDNYAAGILSVVSAAVDAYVDDGRAPADIGPGVGRFVAQLWTTFHGETQPPIDLAYATATGVAKSGRLADAEKRRVVCEAVEAMVRESHASPRADDFCRTIGSDWGSIKDTAASEHVLPGVRDAAGRVESAARRLREVPPPMLDGSLDERYLGVVVDAEPREALRRMQERYDTALRVRMVASSYGRWLRGGSPGPDPSAVDEARVDAQFLRDALRDVSLDTHMD